MIHIVNDKLSGVAGSSGDEAGRGCYVDIHCHCLAGIDDGPATNSDALALCQALVDDGIGTVVATPHQLGRFGDYNKATYIREKVFALNEELKSNNIALAVLAGADVRVDERICELLKRDEILTLADGDKYILLELPHEVFIDIELLLVELSFLGIQGIISHPERHPVLAKQPDTLLKWLERPAHLQLTAGSLLGEFGRTAQRAAWQFLSSGIASLVATDSHNLSGRRPCMRAAFEHISIKLGGTIARLVCIENPLRVLKGQDIISASLYKHEGVCNDERLPSNSC